MFETHIIAGAVVLTLTFVAAAAHLWVGAFRRAQVAATQRPTPTELTLALADKVAVAPPVVTRGTFDIEDLPKPMHEYTPEPSFKQRVSSTLVKEAVHSALEAKHYLEKGRPDSKAFRDGRLLHMASLEPDQYDRHVVVSEAAPKERGLIKMAIENRQKFDTSYVAWDGKRTTKAGREEYAELVAANPEMVETMKRKDLDAILAVADAHIAKHGPTWVEVISEGERAWHRGIVQALRNHPVARRWLFEMKGEPEATIDWVDPRTGCHCGTRVDRLNELGGDRGLGILELKFMSDVRPGKFAASMASFGYDVQTAFTADGAGHARGQTVSEVMIIAVSKSAPYIVAPYRCTEEKVLSHGREKYMKGLDTLELAAKTGVWSGAYSEPIEINLPAYALADDEDDEGTRAALEELGL